MEGQKQPWKVELERQGRTNRWLADLLGVSEGQVSRWARGRVTVPEDRKREIAIALGRNPAELWPAGTLSTGQRNGAKS